jgi:GTP cyclohydrolase I
MADRIHQTALINHAVCDILDALVEDWREHPHLKDTPRRFAKAIVDLTTPHNFEFTTFPNEGPNRVNQMVVVQGIDFWTLCAHHMLPFYGQAHIAYIPDKKVVGLSKLARTVVHHMRGLNIQEEMTQDIHDFLDEHLDPLGAMVVLEGQHMCMGMRGVERPAAITTTSAISGVFEDPSRGARSEFLNLIRRK